MGMHTPIKRSEQPLETKGVIRLCAKRREQPLKAKSVNSFEGKRRDWPFKLKGVNRLCPKGREQVVRPLKGREQAGYSSPTQSAIREYLNLSLAEYSLFGSILTFGAMICAISSGPMADFFGRKGILWSFLEMTKQDIQEAHAGQNSSSIWFRLCIRGTFIDGSVKYTMTSMNVPEPVVSLAVSPVSKDSRKQFSKALNQFQREDPTFRVGLDPESGQVFEELNLIMRIIFVTGAGDETLRFWNVFPSPKCQVMQNTESEIVASSFGRMHIR
ncbi:hypothetical protein LXL04_019535 [Taraxacum kok-saghyz]